MMNDIERSLVDAGKREPAPDLRERVLAATMPLVRRDRSRLDRIWFSPRWRMAAALALLVLAAADVASGRVGDWAPAAQSQTASNTVRAVEMAAREVGLTPDVTRALVAQATAAARASTASSNAAGLMTGGSQ